MRSHRSATLVLAALATVLSACGDIPEARLDASPTLPRPTVTTSSTFSTSQLRYLATANLRDVITMFDALEANRIAESRRVSALREHAVSDHRTSKHSSGSAPRIRISSALTETSDDAAFLACTRGHESDTAGGYRAYNPEGPYFGAYQFLQSTWDKTAQHAGRPDLIGVNILNVAPSDQDAIALDLYHWQGKAPWGGRC